MLIIGCTFSILSHQSVTPYAFSYSFLTALQPPTDSRAYGFDLVRVSLYDNRHTIIQSRSVALCLCAYTTCDVPVSPYQFHTHSIIHRVVCFPRIYVEHSSSGQSGDIAYRLSGA